MTSGRGRTVNYSTFDKPTKITQGGNTVWFSYGPEVNRYKRVEHNGTDVTTTYYVGNVEFIEKNGIQTIKRMIGGVVEVSELFNSKGESILDYTYLFKDHLGSVVATTNHKGQNTQQLAFDAWGQRRPANWSTPSYYDGYAMGLTGITNSLLMPLPVNTGFTGHEHVDSVGLIHMNGRIYDPVLGRFLSADPFIQYPSVVQNLNRYSYLMNNPLNATDPTGYFVDKIVQQGFVQAVTTVALTAIHPALGAAYVAYNAAGSAKSMMQAAQVWQGGGDLPWGDMLVNSLFSQAIGGMMGMIGGGIVESNRQARIAAELGKAVTDLKVRKGAVSSIENVNGKVVSKETQALAKERLRELRKIKEFAELEKKHGKLKLTFDPNEKVGLIGNTINVNDSIFKSEYQVDINASLDAFMEASTLEEDEIWNALDSYEESLPEFRQFSMDRVLVHEAYHLQDGWMSDMEYLANKDYVEAVNITRANIFMFKHFNEPYRVKLHGAARSIE